jgi:GTP-binding protein
MKFVDEAKIHVKAGDGGKGCASFRRAKFIPRGGPDGGDGGKAGDVTIVGKKGLSSLLDFKYKKIYKAENGKNGSGNNKKGRDGKDIFISVPLGTIVYDVNYSIPVCDITEDEEKYIIAKGGRGGRGNTRFATPTNRAPVQFDYGGEGEEKDIGIVGLPNAGKSTLISRLTDAKPRIGDYPFTTLTPTLGVMRDNDRTFVIADIPGIIDGASKGRGLGLMFLKHIERTGKLLVLLDLSSPSIEEDYTMLLNELTFYNEEMLKKERILALNKTDLSSPSKVRKWKAYFTDKGEEVVKISALTGHGVDVLGKLISREIQKNCELRIAKCESEDAED